MRPAPIDPPEIARHLWDDVAPGFCGWDIGANCGQTLPEMTARFRRVLAFEPATECEPYLEPWTRTHGVELHQVALSERAGELVLAALPEKISTGQLVTPFVAGMEWSQADWDAAVSAHARSITATTVDQLVFGDSRDRPDFCKIDVEGHEMLVLAGAVQTVQTYRPAFLIEFHSTELHRGCVQWLEDRGYQVATVRHPHYPPGSDLWYCHGWLKADPVGKADR